MGLVDSLKSGNEGNAQGLMERQQAFKDIGSGVLQNKPTSTATTAKAAPAKRNSATQYGSRPGEKRIPDKELNEMRKPLGSYKKGGKVKKTGIYKLHKKERVLNASQTKKIEKKGGLAAALRKA